MKYYCFIRRNSDGKVVMFEKDSDFGDENEESYWSEGNFSCDCNRRIKFEEVFGEDSGNEDCGHGEFSVIVINEKEEIIYSDLIIEEMIPYRFKSSQNYQ